MIRTKFERDLNKLTVDLNKMCHLVVTAIEDCITAFKTQDKELAKEIIDHDKIINDCERSIEARCLSLLLSQTPLATDLRNVSSALKVVTDLERIGDQSADIAELIISLDGEYTFKMVEHIPSMASVAKRMVKDSIEAFTKGDLELAKATKKVDDQLDAYFKEVKLELNEILKETPEKADVCIDFLMIAKYLERIGDHAVNICEWVEFNETGNLNNKRLL
ncbi:phosphate signaling complex protein PhoU [Tannockella kyphosi]|uniref:phosphate signaling complex protein PhoU n=1 Tax=Tannockella kyphosi TaxID=2899121 RepID=UPI002012CA82|nr:phosphate signaling complex protein PhoU [Tannockella kyphosi]